MPTNGTQDHTLQDLLDTYFKRRVLAAPTKARFMQSAVGLCRFVGGATMHPADVALSRLDEALMTRHRDACIRRMRPVSVCTERRHLSTLFNAAVRYKWMSSNPLKEVSAPPVPRALPKALHKSNMLGYLEFLEQARHIQHGRVREVLHPQWFWHTLLTTMYFTGIRRRQVVGLRWCHVNFEARTILLSGASSKNHREWIVPMADELVAPLLTLRDRTVELVGNDLGARQVFALPLFSRWSANFVDRELRSHNVDAFFKRLSRRGPQHLGRISAHRVRHTTATVLANSVPNLKLVQEQLGHGSITTTYGYVHPDIDAMRRAITALGAGAQSLTVAVNRS